MELLQIYLLFRQIEDPLRCPTGEEAKSYIWIPFSFCHWLRI